MFDLQIKVNMKGFNSVYLIPVVSNLWEIESLTQIHKIQHIFLEAAASKSQTGFKAFVPDPGVQANDVSHFFHIRTSGLTYCTDGANVGYTLGYECIGG